MNPCSASATRRPCSVSDSNPRSFPTMNALRMNLLAAGLAAGALAGLATAAEPPGRGPRAPREGDAGSGRDFPADGPEFHVEPEHRWHAAAFAAGRAARFR